MHLASSSPGRNMNCIVNAVIGRNLSQSTSLVVVSSRQHRPHCHCCDWKESVTVNQVWLWSLQGSTDHIVTAVIGRNLSVNQVWLWCLQGSTDHIVTAVIGRNLSQSTSLVVVSSRQRKPHCHCCDWKESVTINQSGCGVFKAAQTTLSLL